ncbi:MAG: hypothetical protein LC775_20295, partial [Acidobacteria bacterium]|nr:hypothetical protein [Acidobacteriota bacterium]
VPLVVRNRSVAVLYADSADLDSDAINLEAIETLVCVSGMAVELLAVRTAPARPSTAPQPAPAEKSVAEGSRTYKQPAYTPTAEYDEITQVVEESAPAAEVTEFDAQPEAQQFEAQYEPQQFESQPEPQRFEPEPPQVERPSESQYEFEQVQTPPAVPIPVELAADIPPTPPSEPAASAGAPRKRYGADVELPVEVASDEERRLHNDARRFARLLVSEIKLYNEQKVSEGRSNGDLYARLREYIDRSREMYDKRVRPEVAQRYDYFHHELVATLAEGDGAKLGSAYPGATVSA